MHMFVWQHPVHMTVICKQGCVMQRHGLRMLCMQVPASVQHTSRCEARSRVSSLTSHDGCRSSPAVCAKKHTCMQVAALRRCEV